MKICHLFCNRLCLVRSRIYTKVKNGQWLWDKDVPFLSTDSCILFYSAFYEAHIECASYFALADYLVFKVIMQVCQTHLALQTGWVAWYRYTGWMNGLGVAPWARSGPLSFPSPLPSKHTGSKTWNSWHCTQCRSWTRHSRYHVQLSSRLAGAALCTVQFWTGQSGCHVQLTSQALGTGLVLHTLHVVCGSIQNPGAALGFSWWGSVSRIRSADCIFETPSIMV